MSFKAALYCSAIALAGWMNTSAAHAAPAAAEADPTQRLGTVSMHHAWGAGPDNVPVSVLIDKDAMREAHNFVPRMSAIPVTVRRAA